MHRVSPNYVVTKVGLSVAITSISSPLITLRTSALGVRLSASAAGFQVSCELRLGHQAAPIGLNDRTRATWRSAKAGRAADLGPSLPGGAATVHQAAPPLEMTVGNSPAAGSIFVFRPFYSVLRPDMITQYPGRLSQLQYCVRAATVARFSHHRPRSLRVRGMTGNHCGCAAAIVPWPGRKSTVSASLEGRRAGGPVRSRRGSRLGGSGWRHTSTDVSRTASSM